MASDKQRVFVKNSAPAVAVGSNIIGVLSSIRRLSNAVLPTAVSPSSIILNLYIGNLPTVIFISGIFSYATVSMNFES